VNVPNQAFYGAQGNETFNMGQLWQNLPNTNAPQFHNRNFNMNTNQMQMQRNQNKQGPQLYQKPIMPPQIQKMNVLPPNTNPNMIYSKSIILKYFSLF